MCAAVICAKDIMSSVITTATVTTSKEKQGSGDHDNHSKPDCEPSLQSTNFISDVRCIMDSHDFIPTDVSEGCNPLE